MKFKTVSIITGICGLFFGLLTLLVPGEFYAFYGGVLGDSGMNVAQLQGAAYLGFAMLLFFAAKVKDLAAQRAIAIGLSTHFVIGFIVTLKNQLAGNTNAWGWSTVAIFFVLAVAYFVVLMKKR